jgi:hypothetical protein
MSFVIQESIEKIDSKHSLLGTAFDLEAFTYMLNKNSCFTSGQLSRENFLKLQIVLNKLQEFGIEYLEILHYHIEENVDESQKQFIE